MNEISQKAQEVMNRLGAFVPENIDNSFDELPILGPYKHDSGTYTGQYLGEDRHGFGIYVRPLN